MKCEKNFTDFHHLPGEKGHTVMGKAWEAINCRQKKHHYSQFMTCCWCFSTDEMDVGLPQTDIKGTDKASNLQSIIVQETDEYGSGLN